MAKPISIAIDGPAGAGKSTIARRLAKELGFYYVDTGAIYRTVAYFFDLWGVSPKDIDGITRYIDELTIGIEYDDEGVQHMIMNGMDVTGDIRTPDLSQKASLVSAHAIVRDLLLDMQREMAEKHNVIMDGRDIGTVVLPKATVKIFLTATPEVRAKRRTEELIAKGQKADYNKILKDIQQRDYQDTDLRAVKVKDCQPVKKSDKLLCFTLDDGTGTDRQILSGIAKYYKPEELVGKTLVAITNLPPRKMMGKESNGMLLSAIHTEKGEEKLNLVMVGDAIPAGAKLC